MKRIAFDIVHNQRSALDHAVYASTAELVGPDLPGTKFPFGDTAKDARKDARRKCRNVPSGMVEYLLAFEPHAEGNRLLWGLNKLRNTKSHRILVPVIATLSPSLVGETTPGLVTSAPTWDPSTGLFRPMFEPPPGNPSAVAFALRIEVQIGAGPLKGEPAIGVFESLCSEVERIISAIEAETARLLRERQ